MTYPANPTRFESATLDQVIDSMTGRLNSVPPGDPTAQLLQEQLEEVTELRDRIAEGEKADLGLKDLQEKVGGYILVLFGLACAGVGVYAMTAPGHSFWGGVFFLVFGLGVVGVCWRAARAMAAQRLAGTRR